MDPLATEAEAVLDRLYPAATKSPLAIPDDAHAIAAAWRSGGNSIIPLQGPAAAGVEVSDSVFDHLGHAVRLKTYRPATGHLPAILYLHGGGFVAGSLESYDLPLRTFARETGWVIVSVDYRLAPEHPYPVGAEDCYAALRYLAAEAASLEIDPARIVVAGDSAGGLLAATTALRARDRNGPSLAGMICLYPNTDLSLDASYPSRTDHDGKIVNLSEFARLMMLYLEGTDRRQPYVSPVMAADLGRLPPGLVITCGSDPLRDEGLAFGRRLGEAGSPSETVHLEGALHGVLSMLPLMPGAGARMFLAIRTFLDRIA